MRYTRRGNYTPVVCSNWSNAIFRRLNGFLGETHLAFLDHDIIWWAQAGVDMCSVHVMMGHEGNKISNVEQVES